MKGSSKETGRYPVETIEEVIERITEAFILRVSYNNKLTYANLVKRKLKRPIDWSNDEIYRIYDNPIVKNNIIFISSMGIREGAIKVVEKDNDFYCLYYNYDSHQREYIFDGEEIYSTGRCMVEIFANCDTVKISQREAYKNLGCALAVAQAEKYLDTNNGATRQAALRYLEGLDDLTDGMSSLLIRKLKTNPELVRQRLIAYSTAVIERRKQAEKDKVSA